MQAFPEESQFNTAAKQKQWAPRVTVQRVYIHKSSNLNEEILKT